MCEESEKNTWSWLPKKIGLYIVGVKASEESKEALGLIPFTIEIKLVKKMKDTIYRMIDLMWILMLPLWGT